MTGQDIQDKLDGIVVDLQTTGKGRTINIAVRGSDGKFVILPLSSSAQGVVSVSELADLQNFVSVLKPIADSYTTNREPVEAALENFKTAQTPHEALMAAATLARKNLNDALEADAVYQAAKTALEAARTDADYVQWTETYRSNFVSENYGNLGEAKGKYAA